MGDESIYYPILNSKTAGAVAPAVISYSAFSNQMMIRLFVSLLLRPGVIHHLEHITERAPQLLGDAPVIEPPQVISHIPAAFPFMEALKKEMPPVNAAEMCIRDRL